LENAGKILMKLTIKQKGMPGADVKGKSCSLRGGETGTMK